MRFRDALTPWVATALILFFVAAVVDIFICLSASWAYSETDTNFTHIGLFRTCNGKLMTSSNHVRIHC